MPSVLDLMFVFRSNDDASREVTATRREAGGPVVIGASLDTSDASSPQSLARTLYVLSPTARICHSLARAHLVDERMQPQSEHSCRFACILVRQVRGKVP